MESAPLKLAWGVENIHPLVDPTVKILLVDCSDSMRKHEVVLLRALNQNIDALRQSSAAYRSYVSVIGFGTERVVLTPLVSLKQFRPIPCLPFSAGTRLFATCCEVFQACLLLQADLDGRKSEISISVITDGMDNESPHADERRCRLLAKDVLDAGMTLSLYALGVDAKRLASVSGFPEKTSIQLTAAPEAMQWTMRRIWCGSVNDDR